MKKFALRICLVFAAALLTAQAQKPGFSNTVHAAFGQNPVLRNPKIEFFGFTDYFTGNITVGKLTFAGDLTWQLVPTGRGVKTDFLDRNVNVVFAPAKSFDIGLGTNLNWTVGPGPSSGPRWSAYNTPYYGGINLENSTEQVSGDQDYPKRGFKVINHYADTAFAVRYKYQNIFEIGFSLPVLHPGYNFNAGIGIKGNINDKFSVGFAYNGPFGAGKNYLYLGLTTSAVEGFTIGAYWNMLTDSGAARKDGASTIGVLLDFEVKRFRLMPEGAVTFWSNTAFGPAGYVAIDTEMSFSKEVLGGLKASWGIGSAGGAPQPGGRIDINPYIVWNINKTNKLSVGAQLIPVFRRSGYYTFGWQVPIAWTLKF